MKKKLLAAMLAAVLVIGIIPATQAQANIDSASAWAREGIQQALDKGIVPLGLQRDYANNITREHFAALALNFYWYVKGGRQGDALIAAGYAVQGRRSGKLSNSLFSDTFNSETIAEAYILGIIGGTQAPTETTPGLFSPNGFLTREQAAVIIRNLMRALGADVSNTASAGFTDINNASGWAVDGINYVRNAGIMGGTNTTPLTFSPQNNYTREQAIITLNNIPTDHLIPVIDYSVFAQDINGISLLFTKAQVIAVWGEPRNTITVNQSEWLVYRNDDYTGFYLLGFNSSGSLRSLFTTVLMDDSTLDFLRLTSYISYHTDPHTPVPLQWMMEFFAYRTGTGSDAETTAPTHNEYVAFELCNAFRAVHGKAPLRWNDQLAVAAQTFADDRAAGTVVGSDGHTGSDGSRPQNRARTAGYTGIVGENVSSLGPSAAVITGWVNSAGHRSNMLGNWTEAGMGVGIRSVMVYGSP